MANVNNNVTANPISLQQLASTSNMATDCKEQEMQCLLHWFKGWSDMQKGDFMKELTAKAVPEKMTVLFDAMNAMDMSDRPPSLFKCQMKLFHQWFDDWNDKKRNEFIMRMELIDPEFVAKFNSEIAATSGQP